MSNWTVFAIVIAASFGVLFGWSTQFSLEKNRFNWFKTRVETLENVLQKRNFSIEKLEREQHQWREVCFDIGVSPQNQGAQGVIDAFNAKHVENCELRELIEKLQTKLEVKNLTISKPSQLELEEFWSES